MVNYENDLKSIDKTHGYRIIYHPNTRYFDYNKRHLYNDVEVYKYKERTFLTFFET